MKKLVFLTGAGMSAESGISTFRNSDGLWEKYPVEQVASIQGYMADPELVINFYNRLRRQLLQASPCLAHRLVASLETDYAVTVITQNVDDLHERAGSKRVLHMHGDLMKLRCVRDEDHEFSFTGEETLETKCPICGAKTRPDIVFFGEVPLYMDQIQDALRECEEFVYIGTSSVVYPAAGFKSFAKSFGAKVTCLNLEIPDHDPYTDVFIQGKATEVVPKWAKEFK